MSVLTLCSTNPKFSWVISKNPATIREKGEPYKKEIRQGVAYGWFPDDTSFRLWFKDNPTACSFAEGINAEYEYLDRTRYASPYLPISLITNCFATAFKQEQEEDVNASAFLETTVEIRSASMLRHITEHFNGPFGFDNGYHFQAEHLAGHAYKVVIKGPNVHRLLNAAMVIFLMFCISAKGIYINLKGDIVEKYIKAINVIDAPYFIRYLFKRNVFSNRDTFLKNKALLDTDTIDLWHGDTLAQRKEAIFPLLEGGSQLIDIGCGELNYTIPLSSRYEQVLAFEADEELRENMAGKLQGRQIENVTLRGTADPESIDECSLLFSGADVLITEVLEHIPVKDAKRLLNSVLNTDFNKLIVTVPNKSFNVNYLMDETEFRHDDHKWEPEFSEFAEFVFQAMGDRNKFDCFIKPIGDSVNGIATSTMAVITRKQKD